MKCSCMALLSAMFLASCATVPTPSAEKITRDVGLDRASLVSEFRCVHSIAPKGARSAAQQEATCIRTKDRLIVARNDKTSGKFISSSSITLSSMSAVRLYKIAVNRQVQIETEPACTRYLSSRPTC